MILLIPDFSANVNIMPAERSWVPLYYKKYVRFM